ncbi:MAG: response regulator [Mariprofundus sp.]|nr:response regulator [Mariprofundus sp.]
MSMVDISIHDVAINYCVLIVDDMATNRLVARSVLARKGFDVEEAGSGEQALAMLKERSYDAVLMDVMMPDMDGLEVCKKIRHELDLPLLPVIMLTSLSEPDDLAHAMAAGATDFIHKPFNPIELLARVNASVSQKRLTDRLDDTESVLFALARMVEAKDVTTGDHCDRLAHRSVIFGKKLGCDYDELEALRRGGVLHDVGKLGIPDALLLKKGPLSADEWTVMRTHPVIGAHLCSALKTMQLTTDIISCHHERWDGSGYPQGLKGEAIPRLARIFQLVDVFDALTAVRPYKAAFSREKAIDIMLNECAKGFWDPILLNSFIELLEGNDLLMELPHSYVEDKSAAIFDSIASLPSGA